MDDSQRPLSYASKLFIGANMILVGGVFWFIALYLDWLDDRSETTDLTGFALAFLLIGGLLLAWGTLMIMRVLRRRR